MSDNQHQDSAVELTEWAENQVGNLPATSNALYGAQMATAQALIALVDEVRDLRLALCGDEKGAAAPGVAGRLGEIAGLLEVGVLHS